MMKRFVPILALLAASFPAQADQVPLPRLNLAQETALRCSAAFGLIAYDQKRGAPGASAYPPLGLRGREFFVRTTARLMDEVGASREQVQALLKQRINELQNGAIAAKDPAAFVGRTVNSCLPLLDAEVPAAPAK